MRKVFPYYFNDYYVTFLKEVIDRENPASAAFDFNSLYEFHDALGSTHGQVRLEAKFLLEVIKYCRDRGVEVLFYGFKNYQKEKLYDKLESRKNRLHSFNKGFLTKFFRMKKAQRRPYWAVRSRMHNTGLKLLNWNDKRFLNDPYHLHESVLKGKVENLPRESLVFTHFRHYHSLRKV
jgi:hypothetical protein